MPQTKPPFPHFLPLHLRNLLGGVGGAHRFESSEAEPSLPIDTESRRGALLGLLLRLQESLPADCERLDQGTIEVVGQFPAAAGGIADVWEGRIGKRKVAIKSYRCYSSSDRLPTDVKFYKEAFTGSHLKHQNIVSFIGWCSTLDHPLALVFDLMENFSLDLYLKSNVNAGRLTLLSDVAHGVEYIHKKNIVHGNIKMTNVLVGSDGRARVAGLGAAYISPLLTGTDIDDFFEAYGSAPELSLPRFGRFGMENAKATKESDMHALGALAYEMFAGKPPIFEEGQLAGIRPKFYRRQSSRPNHPELSIYIWKKSSSLWRRNQVSVGR